MNGAKYFSKLDLSRGFWQIPVGQEDRSKTAFVTPDGYYEFLRMPVGLVNSIATLLKGMRKFLGVDNAGICVDDVIIYNETWEDHLKTIEVLERFRKAVFFWKGGNRIHRIYRQEWLNNSKS